MSLRTSIKSVQMCDEEIQKFTYIEDSLTSQFDDFENCGIMSPVFQLKDVIRANEKILTYIDSLKGKQRIITPTQISKELGMNKDFIELILMANGFEEDN